MSSPEKHPSTSESTRPVKTSCVRKVRFCTELAIRCERVRRTSSPVRLVSHAHGESGAEIQAKWVYEIASRCLSARLTSWAESGPKTASNVNCRSVPSVRLLPSGSMLQQTREAYQFFCSNNKYGRAERPTCTRTVCTAGPSPLFLLEGGVGHVPRRERRSSRCLKQVSLNPYWSDPRR